MKLSVHMYINLRRSRKVYTNTFVYLFMCLEVLACNTSLPGSDLKSGTSQLESGSYYKTCYITVKHH